MSSNRRNSFLSSALSHWTTSACEVLKHSQRQPSMLLPKPIELSFLPFLSQKLRAQIHPIQSPVCWDSIFPLYIVSSFLSLPQTQFPPSIYYYQEDATLKVGYTLELCIDFCTKGVVNLDATWWLSTVSCYISKLKVLLILLRYLQNWMVPMCCLLDPSLSTSLYYHCPDTFPLF